MRVSSQRAGGPGWPGEIQQQDAAGRSSSCTQLAPVTCRAAAGPSARAVLGSNMGFSLTLPCGARLPPAHLLDPAGALACPVVRRCPASSISVVAAASSTSTKPAKFHWRRFLPINEGTHTPVCTAPPTKSRLAWAQRLGVSDRWDDELDFASFPHRLAASRKRLIKFHAYAHASASADATQAQARTHIRTLQQGRAHTT